MGLGLWRTFNNGVKIIVEIDGHKPVAIPWEAADEIAEALKLNARIVEQNMKANQVIYDAAIVARTGLPIGLIAPTPMAAKMKDEARKVSENDRGIRKSNLPKIGSIPGQEVFGTPKVTVSPSLEDLKESCRNSKH